MMWKTLQVNSGLRYLDTKTENYGDKIWLNRQIFQLTNLPDSELKLIRLGKSLLSSDLKVENRPLSRIEAANANSIERADLHRIIIFQLQNLVDNQTDSNNQEFKDYIEFTVAVDILTETQKAGVELRQHVVEFLENRVAQALGWVPIYSVKDLATSGCLWVDFDEMARPRMIWNIKKLQENQKLRQIDLALFMLEYARYKLYTPGIAESFHWIIDARGSNVHRFSLARLIRMSITLSKLHPLRNHKIHLSPPDDMVRPCGIPKSIK